MIPIEPLSANFPAHARFRKGFDCIQTILGDPKLQALFICRFLVPLLPRKERRKKVAKPALTRLRQPLPDAAGVITFWMLLSSAGPTSPTRTGPDK